MATDLRAAITDVIVALQTCVQVLDEEGTAATPTRVTRKFHPICICQLEGHTGLGRIRKDCPSHGRR